jgi:hypothetical protein
MHGDTIKVIELRQSRLAEHPAMPGKVLVTFVADEGLEHTYSIAPEDLALLAEQFAVAADAMIEANQ